MTGWIPALTGAQLIGDTERSGGAETFRAVQPRSGAMGELAVREATVTEVEAAATAAASAFEVLRSRSGSERGRFLRACADELEAAGAEVVALADAETALGEPRLPGELGRACGQLRAFAEVVEAGSHLDIVIDHADPDATPPRPDLRRMVVPLGPVAVFGASNFPLAFSVPGGDTAAALAAGCPVVVKGHPSHPATSERCARALRTAAVRSDLPAGVVNLVQGRSVAVGQALVQAPDIAAVGFTGSHRAGRALFDLAAARDVPIPVYAEMGSVNPLFVTSGALAARGAAVAEGFVGSLTLGVGQFCTKPGLVFVPDDAAGRGFIDAVAALLVGHEPQPLLNHGIRDAFTEAVAETAAIGGVEVVVTGASGTGDELTASPTLLTTDWQAFRAHPELAREHFGPAAVVVRCGEGFLDAAAALTGNLTASVHSEPDESSEVAELQQLLVERVGRVIHNGYPTGVAVTAAQHHGGPYPATTAPLHTSVGATAIRRFLRPVTFQNTPEALLPEPLQEANPLGISRTVDGRVER